MGYWSVPLLAAIANVALCVVVYRHDRRNPLNRVFCLLTATIVSWNLNIFSLYVFSDPERANYWSTVFRVGTLLMPPAVVHLFLVFGRKRLSIYRAYLIAAYGLVTFLVLANACGWLVAGVRRYDWGYYPVPNPLYGLHTLSVVVNCLVAGLLVVDNIRRAPSPQERVQAKFWLLAATVGLLAGVTNLLPMYHVPIYPLGNLGNVAYTAIVAYAIVRHRLMDIDIVITKGVAYALVTIALILPVFAALVWMQQRAFGRMSPDFSMALLVSYLLIAGLFPLLRRRTEARIGYSLFREKQEARATLAAFTNSIIRILDRGTLLQELGTTLTQALQSDRIAIFLQDSDQTYRLQHSVGIRAAAEEFARHDVFVGALARRGEAVLREELEAAASATEAGIGRDVCRINGWEVCMPLLVSGRLIGFVNLGRKRNMDVFSAGDLELLNTLAAETAIALENARLNEELRRSQDLIQRAGRLSALGTLAAGIAHEVRNPLVSIQTFFQLAPDRLHDEEFFTTFLGITAAEVKRISNLITELLSFARSPTRALGPVDLNATVERVVTLLEPEARKHGLTLTQTLAPGVPFVHADGDQVKQVLINLVLNAIQATEPDGSIAITSRALRRQGALFGQVEVRDTGVGIPPNRLDDIFNPFFTTKDKGTGLGLSIAHQIIAEHGGTLSVESQEGRGTSFFVDLPASTEMLTESVEDDVASPERRQQPYRQRKLAS